MGMTVAGIKKDLLVNAWYTGGVDVIDFTKPTRLKEIAYYDPVVQTGTWSAYPYTGPLFRRSAAVSRSTRPTASRTTPTRRAWRCTARRSRRPAAATSMDHHEPADDGSPDGGAAVATTMTTTTTHAARAAAAATINAARRVR